jgi:hypothetical protein
MVYIAAHAMHLPGARGIAMVGFITTRHLFTHSAVIVHEFGVLCLLRCVWRTMTAHDVVTFLECALPIPGLRVRLQPTIPEHWTLGRSRLRQLAAWGAQAVGGPSIRILRIDSHDRAAQSLSGRLMQSVSRHDYVKRLRIPTVGRVCGACARYGRRRRSSSPPARASAD